MRRQQMADNRRTSRRIAALAIACVMAVVAVPFAAHAVLADSAANKSITVTPGTTAEMTGDLADHNLKVDLYQVASGEKDAKYDTWNWTMTDAFAAAAEAADVDVSSSSITQADYAKLANACLQEVKKDGSGITPTATATASGYKASNLKAGLYLIIPQGAAKATKDGTIYGVTFDTDEYSYLFTPVLTFLPGKDVMDPSGNPNTAYGNWIDDATVVLKSTRNDREGAIEIVKTLDRYSAKTPGSFVFRVVATKDGKTTYDNVVTINFDSAGQKSAKVEGIPVGSKVTITEEYDGASYTVTSDKTQTIASVSASEVKQVTFENDYDETFHGGGSITNHFSNEGGSAWSWEGTRHDGTTYQS